MSDLEKSDAVFSKKQLLEAKEFKNRKDALSATVGDSERISKAEARKRIDDFLKRRVN